MKNFCCKSKRWRARHRKSMITQGLLLDATLTRQTVQCAWTPKVSNTIDHWTDARYQIDVVVWITRGNKQLQLCVIVNGFMMSFFFYLWWILLAKIFFAFGTRSQVPVLTYGWCQIVVTGWETGQLINKSPRFSCFIQNCLLSLLYIGWRPLRARLKQKYRNSLVIILFLWPPCRDRRAAEAACSVARARACAVFTAVD